MTCAAGSLLFGFDQLGGLVQRAVLRPSGIEERVPRFRNLDPGRCTDALLTQLLVGKRRRLGLTIELTTTERAAAGVEPWFYELPVFNEGAEQRYFTPGAGLEALLPPAVLGALREGRARLLITNLIEGTLQPLVRAIYAYLESAGIPPRLVGYFCASGNVAELHRELCVEREVRDPLHVAGVRFWEDRTYRDFLLHGARYRLGDGREPTRSSASTVRAVTIAGPWSACCFGAGCSMTPS
jgi:hypothetical protein